MIKQASLDQPTPKCFEKVEQCVEEILARVGHHIVLAIPVGVGKPNQLVNAFFHRARADRRIELRIVTGLTLERPRGATEIERAFLGPFIARVYGDYPELAYTKALRENNLPPNIEVTEFFFTPGAYIEVEAAQQNYISSNYTHAVRDLIDQGVNVVAQLVAKTLIEGQIWYSLGSNPDLTPDLASHLRAQEKRGKRIALIGQVNQQLPFMYHDALWAPAQFDAIVDSPAYYTRLFGTPKKSVRTQDALIGLYASTLIKDGGTLQLGIGSLGDAIVYACKLRHQDNVTYRQLLADTGIRYRFGEVFEAIGGDGRFDQGLYGATEILTDGFLELYQSGILKRRVYDHIGLQRLLNARRIEEDVTLAMLEVLIEEGVIHTRLTPQDFAFLQRFGIFKPDLRLLGEEIIVGEGLRIGFDLSHPLQREALQRHCLGERLRRGILVHAAFFLGPHGFYETLHGLSEEERQAIGMTRVSRVNQLSAAPALYALQRREARFLNSALMATLSGAVISDGFENGRVVSGVGGQYNFVAMAHALPDARSIILLRSTRGERRELVSNLVWHYGHITVPRHLRDIVVTEYGIAPIRGCPDKEIIARLLNITDSRFQEPLLKTAKRAKKLPADYRIPDAFKRNLPARLEAELKPYRERGSFPEFPFGTDFTAEEQVLLKALRGIKARRGNGWLPIRALLQARKVKAIPTGAEPYLQRLNLIEPRTLKDKLMQKLLVLELLEARCL
ncbi:MAG: acetyl-CoA hydrolase/transferase C-terminal domain-containing protein [Gammaproteobacteria bacterium]